MKKESRRMKKGKIFFEKEKIFMEGETNVVQLC